MPEVGDWVLLDVQADDGETDHWRGEIEEVRGQEVMISYNGMLESKTITVTKSDLLRLSKSEIANRLLVVAGPVWKLKFPINDG